jgi:hypothetical protein
VHRFFFHLYDDAVALDEEGKELSSLTAARERAISEARHIACAEVLDGHLNLKHWIEIADETGKVVAKVKFQDAVHVEA